MAETTDLRLGRNSPLARWLNRVRPVSVAFAFLGNGDSRPVVARQRRGDGSGTPVQLWGHSREDGAFEVRVQASHAEGRGRVELEVEYCDAGLAFGSPQTASDLVRNAG